MYSAIYERRLSVGICRGELTQTGRGLNQNIWYFFYLKVRQCLHTV